MWLGGGKVALLSIAKKPKDRHTLMKVLGCLGLTRGSTAVVECMVRWGGGIRRVLIIRSAAHRSDVTGKKSRASRIRPSC